MIFITNLMTYCIYYITLKVIHKERFGVKPLLFGLLGACCWAPALYFYNVKQRTTNATPALSRNMNQDCSMLNLFDYHDIWHFFSAGKYIKERLKNHLLNYLAELPYSIRSKREIPFNYNLKLHFQVGSFSASCSS